jgi:hypothetical protein
MPKECRFRSLPTSIKVQKLFPKTSGFQRKGKIMMQALGPGEQCGTECSTRSSRQWLSSLAWPLSPTRIPPHPQIFLHRVTSMAQLAWGRISALRPCRAELPGAPPRLRFAWHWKWGAPRCSSSLGTAQATPGVVLLAKSNAPDQRWDG